MLDAQIILALDSVSSLERIEGRVTLDRREPRHMNAAVHRAIDCLDDHEVRQLLIAHEILLPIGTANPEVLREVLRRKVADGTISRNQIPTY